jgi:hypothetical protein
VKIPLALLLLVAVAACAETDPYRRAEAAPTRALTASQAAHAFNARWPRQFKAVQTVTLDFEVATTTLVGYLIVQRPSRFRLQGMTEQGMRLFDLVGNENGDHVEFAAEEFTDAILRDVAQDIRAVFLLEIPGGLQARDDMLEVNASSAGTLVEYEGTPYRTCARLVGEPPRVDSYRHDTLPGDAPLRVNQYEWSEFGGGVYPRVIVLRDPGESTGGVEYKLTIHTTALEPRDEPWPGAWFEVDGG